MHRSSSTTRASEEFLVNFSPASLSLSSPLLNTTAVASLDDLPVYDTNSDHVTKKEIGMHHHNPLGENVIHLIPLVIFLCGFTLWIFSRPAKL
ncbi:hypothetical protein RchiOBHm_Chr2g0089271 [Rosa chinensis]|uniref:Transmembrane protein n=1 Tax=Rosa chinensis TaxID=74649 RepID=A0A2P6RJ69_ROSCH|nr:hypothetical protein RchiOBHm_Chr2g0089271 [Rosa chinensis]